MKHFILILCVLLMPTTCYSKHLHKEAEYQAYWCNARGGQSEYVLSNKMRVDCLLPDMAVEVDFAQKYHECIGQALEYSARTRRTPACVLIVEKDTDWKYVGRLRYTKQRKHPQLRTFTIKPEALNSRF